MITFIEGKPGSGKSNYMVARMRKSVLAGRRVVTNIPLRENGWLKLSPGCWSNIIYVPQEHEGDGLHPLAMKENLEKWAAWRGPVLNDDGDVVEMGVEFFIDEFHFIMPSGTNRALIPAHDFWTMHRHYFVDAWFATQNKGQVRAKTAQLAASHIQLTSNQAVGLGNTYRFAERDGFDGNVLKNKFWNRFDKKAFSLYFSTVGGKTIARKANPSRIYLKWPFLIFYAALALWFWQMFFNGGADSLRQVGIGGKPTTVAGKAPDPVAPQPIRQGVPGLENTRQPESTQTKTAAAPAKEGPIAAIKGTLEGIIEEGKKGDDESEGPREWEPAAYTSYPCDVRWRKGRMRSSSFMLRSQGWRIDAWVDENGRCNLLAVSKTGTVAVAERW